MKKIFLTVLIVLACFSFASCSCSDEDIEGDILAEDCVHYWDNGKIINAATETKTGKIAYTCILCDSVREEVLPKKAHDHKYTGEWKSDRMNHWYDCDIEGCTVKGEKGAHTWEEEILVESNPTTTGKKLLTCTVCSFEKEEDYRARATVTKEEFERATSASAFENVTVTSNSETMKIADGYAQIGDRKVESESICKELEETINMCVPAGYDSLSYDEASRAYYYTTDELTFVMQFADGNLYSFAVSQAGAQSRMTFTKYGRTEIDK